MGAMSHTDISDNTAHYLSTACNHSVLPLFDYAVLSHTAYDDMAEQNLIDDGFEKNTQLLTHPMLERNRINSPYLVVLNGITRPVLLDYWEECSFMDMPCPFQVLLDYTDPATRFAEASMSGRELLPTHSKDATTQTLSTLVLSDLAEHIAKQQVAKIGSQGTYLRFLDGHVAMHLPHIDRGDWLRQALNKPQRAWVQVAEHWYDLPQQLLTPQTKAQPTRILKPNQAQLDRISQLNMFYNANALPLADRVTHYQLHNDWLDEAQNYFANYPHASAGDLEMDELIQQYMELCVLSERNENAHMWQTDVQPKFSDTQQTWEINDIRVYLLEQLDANNDNEELEIALT